MATWGNLWDLGTNLWDLGPNLWVLWTNLWDLGPNLWDLGPNLWDLGPNLWDLGPNLWDLGPWARDQGPGPGTGARDRGQGIWSPLSSGNPQVAGIFDGDCFLFNPGPGPWSQPRSGSLVPGPNRPQIGPTKGPWALGPED